MAGVEALAGGGANGVVERAADGRCCRRGGAAVVAPAVGHGIHRECGGVDSAGRVAGVADGVVATAGAIAHRDAADGDGFVAAAGVLVGVGESATAEGVAVEKGATGNSRRAGSGQAAVVGLGGVGGT